MSLSAASPKNIYHKLFPALVLIGLLISTAEAQCTNPGFQIGKRNFIDINQGLGATPADARDYNGDGKVDVILTYAVSSNGASFAISFGDGTGGFSAPVSYLAGGPSIWKMAIGDINGDGRPDIITSESNLNTPSKIWMNNGAGAFTLSTLGAGGLPFPFLIVDVNGDGKGDMVTGNGSFQVRIGDGMGGFTLGNPLFNPPNNYGLANIVVGDFNGDTTVDLAASYRNGSNSRLIIYNGDGSGNFAPSPAIDTGPYSVVYLAADFNGDGKLDLAGANPNFTGGVAPAAVVLLNNGMGGFTQTNYPVVAGRSVINVQKGDFNGDSKTDLAVELDGLTEPYNARNGLGSILYGNGSGGFTRRDQFKPKVQWDVAADFNNDGLTDGLMRVFPSEIAPFALRTVYATCSPKNITNVIDYDGDGVTDPAVWRPSDGRWFIRYTLGGLRIQPWGDPGDIPAPGDYDGDGKADLAVFRPSNGGWYFINSLDNSQTGVQWGAGGDKPVQGDYDGDGKMDVAVYRPSSGGWYILHSLDGSFAGAQFGIAEDKPVQSDYDGDGKTDLAVYRPSTGIWYVLRSSDQSFFAQQFGNSTDKPVPGDYDGDGKSDVAVFRPSDGYWYIYRSQSASLYAARFGLSTDIPAPCDYTDPVHETTRDGIIDITVRRDSNTAFYSFPSATPVLWGASGDIPVMTPYRIE